MPSAVDMAGAAVRAGAAGIGEAVTSSGRAVEAHPLFIEVAARAVPACMVVADAVVVAAIAAAAVTAVAVITARSFHAEPAQRRLRRIASSVT